jgi:serine/threonine protein kinase/Leucine-rich repeat (LRR) protein
MNPAFKCDCTFNNGATCHITHLKVYAMDITGQIPAELANLTYLSDLNLRQNYLTGPLPAFLGNLTQMQYLSVGINNLSGRVPKELGNLQSLISLSFSSNNFNGILPAELGNLTVLQQLYINSAGVSGEIPSSFGKLQNLQKLWAFDNLFTGRIPDFIGSLKNLIQLRLEGNAFNGPIPSNFSYLTSLTSLRVSDITSGVSSLSFLQNLTKLTQLVLRNNKISGEIPLYIGEFSGLQHLDLSFNNFTGGIPDSLQNLSNLTFLLLGNNNLSGKLLSEKSASLAYLDLSYNQFSGSLPTWLSDNNLNVNLVGNYFATNEIDNRFSGKGLDCLQRTFPCNKGTPLYSRFAINCGGGQMTYGGDVYEQENETLNAASFYVSNTQKWGVSDTGYFMDSSKPSYIATNQSQITKTLDSELYKTARLSPSSLRYYGLGLENGPYTLNLQFAEIQIENTNGWKSLGRRIFDVYVQEQKVLTDFDIRKEAGGSNIAVVKSFNKINVTSNFLEIHFFWAGKGTCCIPIQGAYGPLVSAIRVTPEFNPTKKNRTRIVIGITIGIASALICIILVFLLWRRRVRKLAATDVEEDEAINDIRSKLKIFSYADIKTATGDFSRENKLGEGGYGAVYKGTLSDGEMVAVKQLSCESRQGKREFINEVAVISAVQHRNLVKLNGCCLEADDPLLVYEYLENKSLDQALLGNEKSKIQLDWPTRYNICIGIARGLTYLHEEANTRIIHRDIKASNILLDDFLNPKIADFGLARLYDEMKTHVSTRVAGTVGYLAPEYAMRGHLTEKADVFSFGVVALELVSGRSNTETSLPENMVYLLEWTWHLHEKEKTLDLMDPDIESTCSKEEVLRVIEVALLCTQAAPAMRPSMSRVVAMLTGDIEVNPAASRPGYIRDLQYNNAIALGTGAGSTPVVATAPMDNSAQSLSIVNSDSLTLSSAEGKCNSSKIDSAIREGR